MPFKKAFIRGTTRGEGFELKSTHVDIEGATKVHIVVPAE